MIEKIRNQFGFFWRAIIEVVSKNMSHTTYLILLLKEMRHKKKVLLINK